MPTWVMIVKTVHGEHNIKAGTDQSVALRMLAEAREHIGSSGTVTIAERLAVKAEDIQSVEIRERPDRQRD